MAATSCTTHRGPRAELEPKPDRLAVPVEVRPDTDLRPGDRVRVSGQGFVPGESVRVLWCAEPGSAPAADADARGCDRRVMARDRADTMGSAAATVKPGRVLRDQHGELDCADRPRRCSIVMASADDARYAGRVPISFAPDLPEAERPTVTVSPKRGLRHGDVVRITGRRFPPGTYVTLTQCLDESECPQARSAEPVGPDGRFAATRRVSRVVSLGGDMALECATERCELRVEVGVPSRSFSAPPVTLGFDADGPVPLLPTLAVTPASGLADGQAVLVAADRLELRVKAEIRQCELADGDRPVRCDDLRFAVPANGGRLQTGFRVRRSFDSDGHRVDCDVARCAIVIEGVGELGPMIVPDPVPLDFARPGHQ